MVKYKSNVDKLKQTISVRSLKVECVLFSPSPNQYQIFISVIYEDVLDFFHFEAKISSTTN